MAVNIITKKQIKFTKVYPVIILLMAAFAPDYLSEYTIISFNDIYMYVILTVGWAIFSGPTQYISLSSAAFFGIGIYVSAVFGETMPFFAIVALGGIVSFFVALLVGLSTLRLRGMYFTIFTFGLSELIRHAVQFWEVNMTHTVGRLVISIPSVTVYYTMLAILLMTLGTAYFIKHSKYGLALSGIGESEDATEHIGINVNALKIVAFAISTLFMGMAGANDGHSLDLHRSRHCFQSAFFLYAGPDGYFWGNSLYLRSSHWGNGVDTACRPASDQVSLLLQSTLRHYSHSRDPFFTRWAHELERHCCRVVGER